MISNQVGPNGRFSLVAFCLLSWVSLLLSPMANAETSEEKTAGVVEQVAKSVFAPIYVSGKALLDYLDQSKAKFSLRNEIDENGKYLVGWAAYKSAKSAVLRGFFVTSVESFVRATEKQIPTPPKHALVFTTIKDGDSIIVSQAAHELEANGATVEVLHLANPGSLFTHLEHLNQKGKKFDFIEFDMHGSAGKVQFPNGESIGYDELVPLTPRGLNIAEPGATVRLISCGNGGHGLGFSDMGKKFMTALGDRLLTQGGQVFASPKLIYEASEMELVKDYLLPISKGDGFSLNLNLFISGFENNPFLTWADARSVKIPPKSSACPKFFQRL